MAADPQPGEMWRTGTEHTVEILARDMVYVPEGDWSISQEVDAIAFRFTGGTMVHLRSVESLTNWRKIL